MIFSSITFIFLFLPLLLIIYHLIKKVEYKNFILLIFSLFFYAWGEPKYILLMMGSILFNYSFGLLIDLYRGKKWSKGFLGLSIFFNIAVIGVFKYLSFAIININKVGFHIIDPKIALPIGISFFTFQAMSYVIDVYKADAKCQKNIFDLALYISFFPQLIAGPIVRYRTIDTQIKNRTENLDKFTEGVKRFISGLFKKVVLANSAGLVCETIMKTQVTDIAFADSWIAMTLFALQIYFDFSGYSDMAIGLAKMFGFDFLENFNYPYISKSITDFWHRWHISLSTWFRDYVYIPLGGNRGSQLTFIRNIFLVWFLTGLWHGASWNYVIWGLYYCVLLLLEKLFLKKWLNRIPDIFKHAYALFFVIVGWAIFKIEDTSMLIAYLKKMFLIDYTDFATIATLRNIRQNIVTIILSLLYITPLFHLIQNKIDHYKAGFVFSNIVYIGMFVLAISTLTTTSFNPFIYFRF